MLPVSSSFPSLRGENSATTKSSSFDWRRTILCRFFESADGCKNGKHCPFLHEKKKKSSDIIGCWCKCENLKATKSSSNNNASAPVAMIINASLETMKGVFGNPHRLSANLGRNVDFLSSWNFALSSSSSSSSPILFSVSEKEGESSQWMISLGKSSQKSHLRCVLSWIERQSKSTLMFFPNIENGGKRYMVADCSFFPCLWTPIENRLSPLSSSLLLSNNRSPKKNGPIFVLSSSKSSSPRQYDDGWEEEEEEGGGEEDEEEDRAFQQRLALSSRIFAEKKVDCLFRLQGLKEATNTIFSDDNFSISMDQQSHSEFISFFDKNNNKNTNLSSIPVFLSRAVYQSADDVNLSLDALRIVGGEERMSAGRTGRAGCGWSCCLSEAASFDAVAALFGKKSKSSTCSSCFSLSHTESEMIYTQSHRVSRLDYRASLSSPFPSSSSSSSSHVGVSVTRAYRESFASDEEKRSFASDLVCRKIAGFRSAKAAAAEDCSWEKGILHIWTHDSELAAMLFASCSSIENNNNNGDLCILISLVRFPCLPAYAPFFC